MRTLRRTAVLAASVVLLAALLGVLGTLYRATVYVPPVGTQVTPTPIPFPGGQGGVELQIPDAGVRPVPGMPVTAP